MALELPVPTKDHRARNAPGLLSLPSEIISSICSLLCFHCRVDCAVSATWDAALRAYSDQVALAYLSRCSKRLRDIAQPILFHWYHDLEDGDHLRQERQLENFVDTIIRNPHLAASVRALAFYQPEIKRPGPTYAQVRDSRVYEVEKIFRPTIEALGPGHLARRAAALRPACFFELRDLAIASTPKLAQLLLHEVPDGREDGQYNWTSWSYALSSLTSLAFPGVRSTSGDSWEEVTIHIHEAKQLLRQTTNLETLIFPDSGGGGPMAAVNRVIDEPWDVPFPKLKTLSINGIAVPLLGQILAHCPQLEDLEYEETPHDYDDADWTILDPSQHLAHLRPTLRRFCYSVSFNSDHYDEDNSGALRFYGSRYDALHRRDDPGFAACPSGLDLAEFPVLEDLAIDQILLYGPVFAPTFSYVPTRGYCRRETAPECFLAKLPRSLRRLHVAGIIYWPAMYRDLLALLGEVERFPRLERIVLQVYAPPEGADEEEGWDLVDRFWEARGVEVMIWEAAGYPQAHSRGVLPPRPGWTETWIRPPLFGRDL